ncbi:PKD domain-containing protein [Candidatus Woesearchaeota archaeon]|nr:PKD domain-containing protein [Candidatus Woesearchaeota archaeon]
MKQMIYLLSLVLLSISVSAAVDVTYFFDQQNVEVLAFDCLNADCSSARAFSGQIIKGHVVNDGSVILRYPDSLATEFGYAEFFVSSGFRPLVGKHDWHTFGQSGVATAQEFNSFSKMPNTCKAVVSELGITNPVELYKPVVINTIAQLDARTSSAFQLLNTNVAYIPPSLLQEFWGADTVVKLEISNGVDIVHSEEKNFIASENNAVIASSVVPVSFSYTPEIAGNFVAKITASVTDNQCESQKEQSADKSFSVAALQDQLYSILTNIRVNNQSPSVGDVVLVFVDRITNHAVNNSILTPVPAILEFVVVQGLFMNVVSSVSQNVVAAPDAVNFVTETFEFSPSVNDIYTVIVRARANVSFLTSEPEIIAEEQIRINMPLVPLEVIVVPVSGTALNSSSFVMTTVTNRQTFCSWSFNDVDFENMANAFATVDGLAHTAAVSGLSLGSNNVFVTCDGQSSEENLDLAYFVENIIENSVITNSTITNSIIINSTIMNSVVVNANIVNNIISSGTITINGFTYDATINGHLALSQLIPVAPVASFVQTHTIAETGVEVIFTSTSTDANIPGPLNDFLAFFWNFGDGTTATGPVATKKFVSGGTFSVTLTVTDRFGFSDVEQKTIIVVKSSSSVGTKGGGGSRGSIKRPNSRDLIVVADYAPVKKPVPVKKNIEQSPVVEVKQTAELVKKIKVPQNNNFFAIGVLIFLNVVLLLLTAYAVSRFIRRRLCPESRKN